MVFNFYTDLNNAREAERIVLEKFSQLAPQYTFTNVSNERQYFHKGDIKATAADGREIFIEVKDDSRIHQTHNVLCEYKVYYYESATYGRGNMESDYDIYTVVSKAERKIYVLDFPTLQANYKKGQRKEIPHYDQCTYCYLVSLKTLEQCGAIIDIIDY